MDQTAVTSYDAQFQPSKVCVALCSVNFLNGSRYFFLRCRLRKIMDIYIYTVLHSYIFQVRSQIPSRSPALASFRHMIPASPAPTHCSTDSAEVLLRDLVEIYGETFLNDTECLSPSPGKNATSLHGNTGTAHCNGRQYIPDHNATKVLAPVQESQRQPALYNSVPANNHQFIPVPSRQSTLQPNVAAMYPTSPCTQANLPNTVTAATVRIPEFASCPTGGPPTKSESSLLASLGAKSKPLQKILQEECASTSVPLSLIQAAAPATGQIPVKMPLVARTAQLQTSLQNLRNSHKSRAEQLEKFYQIQSTRIESDRVFHLCSSTAAPTLLPLVNQYFDMQQHTLIDNIELQIHCLLYQFLAPSSAEPLRVTSSSIKRCTIPKRTKYNSPEGLSDSSEANSIINILDKCAENNQHQKKTKPNPLNALAVRIMNNWYERNQNNPYPSNDTAEVIAKAGNITVEQVRKWFANKRMRSANTKPQKRRRSQPCVSIESEIVQPNKKLRSGLCSY